MAKEVKYKGHKVIIKSEKDLKFMMKLSFKKRR
jgi:hypothetical protein